MGNPNTETNDQAQELRDLVELKAEAEGIVADMGCGIYSYRPAKDSREIWYVCTDRDNDSGIYGGECVSPRLAEPRRLYEWIIKNKTSIENEMLQYWKGLK